MASLGDVWLTDFGEPYPGEPAYQRPAVVLGPPDSFGPAFPFVVVVPTTTSHRGLSVHVEIDPGPGTGLDDLCYAQCELIRSISVRRLVHRLGRLDLEAGARIDAVVRIVLGH